MSLFLLLLITYPFPVSVDSSPDTLQNAHLRAVITPITSDVRADSFLELYDLESGMILPTENSSGAFNVVPIYIPMNGNVEL